MIMCPMVPNGLKWHEMDQNGLKKYETILNGKKLSKRILSDSNCLDGSKWSKIISYGPKLFKMVPSCLQLSQKFQLDRISIVVHSASLSCIKIFEFYVVF